MPSLVLSVPSFSLQIIHYVNLVIKEIAGLKMLAVPNRMVNVCHHTAIDLS